jgi:hypothetical protein
MMTLKFAILFSMSKAPCQIFFNVKLTVPEMEKTFVIIIIGQNKNDSIGHLNFFILMLIDTFQT